MDEQHRWQAMRSARSAYTWPNPTIQRPVGVKGGASESPRDREQGPPPRQRILSPKSRCGACRPSPLFFRVAVLRQLFQKVRPHVVQSDESGDPGYVADQTVACGDLVNLIRPCVTEARHVGSMLDKLAPRLSRKQVEPIGRRGHEGRVLYLRPTVSVNGATKI